jgi:hypothetical protein
LIILRYQLLIIAAKHPVWEGAEKEVYFTVGRAQVRKFSGSKQFFLARREEFKDSIKIVPVISGAAIAKQPETTGQVYRIPRPVNPHHLSYHHLAGNSCWYDASISFLVEIRNSVFPEFTNNSVCYHPGRPLKEGNVTDAQFFRLPDGYNANGICFPDKRQHAGSAYFKYLLLAAFLPQFYELLFNILHGNLFIF